MGKIYGEEGHDRDGNIKRDRERERVSDRSDLHE